MDPEQPQSHLGDLNWDLNMVEEIEDGRFFYGSGLMRRFEELLDEHRTLVATSRGVPYSGLFPSAVRDRLRGRLKLFRELVRCSLFLANETDQLSTIGLGVWRS